MKDFMNKFLYGMYLDYCETWQQYPAVIVWTTIIAFILGGIIL